MTKDLCDRIAGRLNAVIAKEFAAEEQWHGIEIAVDDVPCVVSKALAGGRQRWTLPLAGLVRVSEVVGLDVAADLLVTDVQALATRKIDGDVLMLHGLKAYERGVGPGRKRMMRLPGGLPLVVGPGDKETCSRNLKAWIRADWRKAVRRYGETPDPATWIYADDAIGAVVTHLNWKLEPCAGGREMFSSIARDGTIVVGGTYDTANERRREYEDAMGRHMAPVDECAFEGLSL
ncbi:MAG: hypothetical protein CL627_07890 [Aurantimonas sp.]|nr:hypothetical protein [Aurantimonas sp.]